jgi:hypothetical protein
MRTFLGGRRYGDTAEQRLEDCRLEELDFKTFKNISILFESIASD